MHRVSLTIAQTAGAVCAIGAGVALRAPGLKAAARRALAIKPFEPLRFSQWRAPKRSPFLRCSRLNACTVRCSHRFEEMMKSLSIVWQRLVDSNGQTCARCGATYGELEQAVKNLEASLKPLGIEPTIEIREIDSATFATDPTQSNRIWIDDKPLEEWLSASVSSSPCCDFCGDSECRTIELDSEVFEAIPAELILKAGLIAAARKIETDSRGTSQEQKSKCCSD